MMKTFFYFWISVETVFNYVFVFVFLGRFKGARHVSYWTGLSAGLYAFCGRGAGIMCGPVHAENLTFVPLHCNCGKSQLARSSGVPSGRGFLQPLIGAPHLVA